jgi:parallel beta-helix repeat protein
MPVILNENGRNKSIVIINANECTVRGLMIKCSENYAITMLSDRNTVTGNIITGSNTGIYLKTSHSNVIEFNNISVEGTLKHGIIVINSSNNTLKGNSVSFNGVLASGIDLIHSNRNLILSNKVKGNGWIGGSGISSQYSDSNFISTNTINSRGLWGSSVYIKDSTNNTLDNNKIEHLDFSGSGITLCESNYNSIINNSAKGKGNLNCAGIFLRWSDGNNIMANNASSAGMSGSGVSLVYSGSNIIKGNKANYNDHGIYLYASENNTLEDNTAQSNNDYDIFIDFFSPNNLVKHNIANIYIVEPRWCHIESNNGKVIEFTVDYPDQVPVLTLSDIVDTFLHISQFVLGVFNDNI